MSELIGYIEATKIEPKLEDITITPSKQEQNFKSKVDGYDRIRVNAIPCETLNVTPTREKQVIEGMYDKVNVDAIAGEILNVTPKKEHQYFDGLYEKIYVDAIERDNLTVTPSNAQQSFNGLYENVVVEKVTGDTLNITPTEEQQSFNGLYENVNVEAIEAEEVTMDLDFSTQDTFEVAATEGKYITKAIVNKDANLAPENILEGNNIYGVDGTFKPLDTSDATATANDISLGKIAYVNGEKITGTLEIETSNFNADIDESAIVSGFWNTKTNDYSTNIHKAIKKINTPITLDNKDLDTSVSPARLYATFAHCTSLEEVVELNFANVAYPACYIFVYCEKLKKSPNIINSKNLTNISGFFSDCTRLVDVSYFDISGATNMSGMFYNCKSLSDESLNTILLMCSKATKVTANKTLKHIGLTSTQATKCQSLSNYAAFTAAGWTTGY